MIICLLPRLSLDLRFRMMGALLGRKISIFLNCLFLRLLYGYRDLGHRVSWLTGWRQNMSIRENDFSFSCD